MTSFRQNSARPALRRIAAATAALGISVMVTAGLATAPASAAPGLYDSAKRALIAGNGPDGVATLNRLLTTDPRNAKALALRAVLADFDYDFGTKTDSLTRLSAVDQPLRAGVDRMLNAVANTALTPPNPFPSIIGPQTAVVILGYGLLPNGAMRPELIGRLKAGLVQALAAPASPIIVTGGNPQNNISEAVAMKSWLTRLGIPAGRVHAETKAPSTIGNAIYSAQVMRSIGASSAVLVTDPDHIRRATVDFLTAGVPVVGGMATLDGYLQQVFPVALKSDQRAMYVDGAGVLGL